MAFSVNPLKTITAVPTGPSTGATAASPDFNNFGYRGITLTLSATGSTGNAPTIAVKLQGKDPVTEQYYDIHGAAFATKSANMAAPDYLTVYPGVAETANQTVSDVLPKTWRVYTTIGGTGGAAYTYSVGATLIP